MISLRAKNTKERPRWREEGWGPRRRWEENWKQNQVHTVFVNNVPERVGASWLQSVFEDFGKVREVFISVRRSKAGRKFGFIRFERLWEAARAMYSLDDAWLLGCRLEVNMAKYDAKGQNKSNGRRLGGRQQTKEWERETERDNTKAKVSNKVIEEVTRSSHLEGGRQMEKKEKECKGVVNQEVMERLKRSVVAKAEYQIPSEMLEKYLKDEREERVMGSNIAEKDKGEKERIVNGSLTDSDLRQKNGGSCSGFMGRIMMPGLQLAGRGKNKDGCGGGLRVEVADFQPVEAV
ncbi:RNA recognition motif domain - like 10 [Theobroma cacao]|nr:RNA recognition motif domain - like 10 [Theobroma cacao]